MKHHTLKIAFAALLLASACTTTPAPYEPKAMRAEYREGLHMAPFEGKNHHLTSGESVQLEEFFSGINPQAVAEVWLSGNGRQKGMNSHLAHIKKRLVEKGIAAKLIHIDNTEMNAEHAVTIRVNHAQMVAPEGCPDWSGRSQDNFDNVPMSNFGCAYYTSFGQQIANPADVIQGKGNTGINAARTTVVIDSFEKNEAAAGFEQSGESAVSTTTAQGQ